MPYIPWKFKPQLLDHLTNLLALQDPLWCQIWCHLPPDTVLLREPHLISRDKVCSFVNAVLSRYMARGIEINSRSTVTQYLLEVLNGHAPPAVA